MSIGVLLMEMEGLLGMWDFTYAVEDVPNSVYTRILSYIIGLMPYCKVLHDVTSSWTK